MKTNNVNPLPAVAVRTALAENAFDLSFIKANGDERHMVCTTNPVLIGEVVGTDGRPHYQYIQELDAPTDLVLAFDLQLLEWRSFYAASVFRFEEWKE